MSVSPGEIEAEGLKIVLPLNSIDVWTRWKELLGLKLKGHTDTLTEASNLTDEFLKRVEVQDERHYRNAFVNFKNSSEL